MYFNCYWQRPLQKDVTCQKKTHVSTQVLPVRAVGFRKGIDFDYSATVEVAFDPTISVNQRPPPKSSFRNINLVFLKHPGDFVNQSLKCWRLSIKGEKNKTCPSNEKQGQLVVELAGKKPFKVLSLECWGIFIVVLKNRKGSKQTNWL